MAHFRKNYLVRRGVMLIYTSKTILEEKPTVQRVLRDKK
jgi:hypothetical protein